MIAPRFLRFGLPLASLLAASAFGQPGGLPDSIPSNPPAAPAVDSPSPAIQPPAPNAAPAVPQDLQADSLARDTAQPIPSPSIPTPAPSAAVPSPEAVEPATPADSAPIAAAPAVEFEVEPDSVKEKRLRSDPRAAEKYRSPRRAFFLSLVLPGAGQVYTGSWIKAAVFATTEVVLGTSWWYVAVKKSDEKLREARRYAEQNWSQGKYESEFAAVFIEDPAAAPTELDLQSGGLAGRREDYCRTMFEEGSAGDDQCMDLVGPGNAAHRALVSRDTAWIGRGLGSAGDSVRAFRSRIVKDQEAFYELISRGNEFVRGWADVGPESRPTYDYLDRNRQLRPGSVNQAGDAYDATPYGSSQMALQYLSMRQDANDLARTQSWFIGGMILNHVLSAVDAAITAQRINRRLYELESRWWENLHFQGGLAYSGGTATTAGVWLDF